MKVRNVLINGLLIAITMLALTACATMATDSTSQAYNKQLLDFNYAFDTAIIDTHYEIITVKVKSWKDYEDGEQLQITAQDGTVYLTSSYNCTLIKSGK